MKAFIIAAFGVQVLLGNVCLMNVAYAAGEMPSVMSDMEVTVHQCHEGGMCSADDADHMENAAPCLDGHCSMQFMPSVLSLSQSEDMTDAPVILPVLTMGTLSGDEVTSSLASEGTGPPGSGFALLTVVLRQ